MGGGGPAHACKGVLAVSGYSRCDMSSPDGLSVLIGVYSLLSAIIIVRMVDYDPLYTTSLQSTRALSCSGL